LTEESPKIVKYPAAAASPEGPLARRGGEGRPFIPPAELGGILEYFDKTKEQN